MYSYIEERVLAVADYIIDHQATVRAAAGAFKISKSTVHKDMQERLKGLDPTGESRGGDPAAQQGRTPYPRRHGHPAEI